MAYHSGHFVKRFANEAYRQPNFAIDYVLTNDTVGDNTLPALNHAN